jgi:DNA-binding NarL/FixJ family response regulator
MNAKAISTPPAPGQAEPPDATAASQVAMVVMLVPIATPSAGMPPAPPSYVDSHDHVWLLVDKASPMAAVFEQITAAEAPALLEQHHTAGDHSPWPATAHSHPATVARALSSRELDVLRLLADGRSNQEIAQVLVVTLNTVKMHIKHIYRKLGVKNRVQAGALARGLGLLETAMH